MPGPLSVSRTRLHVERTKRLLSRTTLRCLFDHTATCVSRKVNQILAPASLRCAIQLADGRQTSLRWRKRLRVQHAPRPLTRRTAASQSYRVALPLRTTRKVRIADAPALLVVPEAPPPLKPVASLCAHRRCELRSLSARPRSRRLPSTPVELHCAWHAIDAQDYFKLTSASGANRRGYW